MNHEKLKEILELHLKWLNNDEDGNCADLEGANLRRANLEGVNLEGANLYGADLRRADLEGVNLEGVNLEGVNLYGADLEGANLEGANLWSTVGNMKEIKSLQLETYPITYTKEVMQIGCQCHSIEEWFNFSDEKISEMDRGALEWWQKWKPVIQEIISKSPAVGTETSE